MSLLKNVFKFFKLSHPRKDRVWKSNNGHGLPDHQRILGSGRRQGSLLPLLLLSFAVYSYTVSPVSEVHWAVFSRSSLHPCSFVCRAVSVVCRAVSVVCRAVSVVCLHGCLHWPNCPPQAVMVWTPLQNVFCYWSSWPQVQLKRRRDQLQF